MEKKKEKGRKRRGGAGSLYKESISGAAEHVFTLLIVLNVKVFDHVSIISSERCSIIVSGEVVALSLYGFRVAFGL